MEKKNLIVRILGNDLCNLHGDSQTIHNLLFTLDNEPLFENTDKIYVLNRILDNEKRNTIIDILTKRNIFFFELPFEYNEYKKNVPIIQPNVQNILNKIMGGKSLHNSERGTISLGLMCHRLYIMNINQARNWCIDYGKSKGYTWTFVFDSNAFLTKKMYDDIIHNIQDETEYISIPQIRLHDGKLQNFEILNSPEKLENLPYNEHQLAFKNTSKYTFNVNIPYGTMNKGEMLNALGIPGRWEKWKKELDFLHIEQRKFTNVRFQTLSKVIRLDPGNIHNDISTNWVNRMVGTYKLSQYIQSVYGS